MGQLTSNTIHEPLGNMHQLFHPHNNPPVEAQNSFVPMKHLSLREAEHLASEHPARMWQTGRDLRSGHQLLSAIILRAPWRLDHLSHDGEFSDVFISLDPIRKDLLSPCSV